MSLKPGTVYPAQRSIGLGGDGRKSKGAAKRVEAGKGQLEGREADRESRVNRKSTAVRKRTFAKELIIPLVILSEAKNLF